MLEIIRCVLRDLLSIGVLWWLIVLLFAGLLFVLGSLLVKKQRISRKNAIIYGTLLLYMFFLFVGTVLARKQMDFSDTPPAARINLDILSTWVERLRAPIYVSTELFFNILMFIPLGGLMKAAGWKNIWIIVVSVLFSLCIESLQLVLGKGFFELNDLLSNTVGSTFGILIFLLVRRLVREAKAARK